MKQADYKYMEERPWGKFYIIQETNDYKIKRIEVNSNQRLSYQYHKKDLKYGLFLREKEQLP